MNLLRAISSFRQTAGPSRRHSRHECFIPARMHFLDHGFDMDGFVDEISLSGLRFRPAQLYLMRRTSSIVRIRAGDMDFVGILRNASPKGYGIELRMHLDEQILDDLIAEHPLVTR